MNSGLWISEAFVSFAIWSPGAYSKLALSRSMTTLGG